MDETYDPSAIEPQDLLHRVQWLELKLRQKEDECSNALAQTRRLQENTRSSLQTNLSLLSVQQLLENSNQRNSLQEKQAEILQNEVTRLRNALQATRQNRIEHATDTGLAPTSEYHTLVRDMVSGSNVKADQDSVLARSLPSQLVHAQILQLVGQVSSASAIATDLFEDTILRAHCYREIKQSDARELERRIVDLELQTQALINEKEVLRDALKSMQHENDIAEEKVVLLSIELTRAKQAAAMQPEHQMGDDSAGDLRISLRNELDNGRVACGMSVTRGSPKMFKDEIQQSATGHAILQNKVDELMRLLADANAAREECELRYQTLTTIKVNADLELEDAKQHLAAANSLAVRMQHRHSIQKAEIMNIAATLYEQITQLDTALEPNLNIMLFDGIVVESADVGGQTRSHGQTSFRGRRVSSGEKIWNHDVRGSPRGVSRETRGRLVSTPLWSPRHGATASGSVSPRWSSQHFETSVGLSGDSHTHLVSNWSPSDGSHTPRVMRDKVSLPREAGLGARAQTRGMLLYLDMPFSNIGDLAQFEAEILEELSLAVNISADQLRMLNVEAVDASSQHRQARSTSPGTAKWGDASCPAAYVVVEVEIAEEGARRETAGSMARTSGGTQVVRWLIEQLPLAHSVLRMGVHASKIFCIVPLMECSPSSTHTHANQHSAIGPLNRPAQPWLSLLPGVPSHADSHLIAVVKEELLAEVAKVKDWAKDEVTKERRQNLHLQQKLQHAFVRQRELVEQLEETQSECRTERRERMRFAAAYVSMAESSSAEIGRMEKDMTNKTIKTEKLLSQISTLTRAAYCSLCALCVRSRLEIEGHKRKMLACDELVNKYRHALRAFEQERNLKLAGSAKQVTEAVHLTQTVALAMQKFIAEMAELVHEVEALQQDEAVVQSISTFLEHRLLQSCEELDAVESELNHSMADADVLRRQSEEQSAAICDLQRDLREQTGVLEHYRKQFEETSIMVLDLSKDVRVRDLNVAFMIEHICGASNSRRRRNLSAATWHWWAGSVRIKVLRNMVGKLAQNRWGRLHESRAFAAAVLQNWRFTAQRDRQRRLFGTFLWEIAQRTSCTRVYTRMMRTWHAALMQGWKFRMCARAHAGLHRRRVWHHCFQHWRHAAGAPVLSNKTWAQSGPSAAACDVILDPSKKPIVLKWQRMCIGLMLQWVRDQAVEGFLKNSKSPTLVQSPAHRLGGTSLSPNAYESPLHM